MMRFSLQKLTLLDYPGVVSCTVFGSGCNFRCPFCHNASLVTGRDEDMPFSREEILNFLDKRRGVLDGVCFTGGEFLLHSESVPIITAVKEMGFKVKVDTNGSFPDKLQYLIDRHAVDYIAMDIKNSPEHYALATGGVELLPAVRNSVDILRQGAVGYEFRTTVAGNIHTAADFSAIGDWISGAPRYYLQRFSPSGDILAPGEYAVSDELLNACLAAVKPRVPAAALRGE